MKIQLLIIISQLAMVVSTQAVERVPATLDMLNIQGSEIIDNHISFDIDRSRTLPNGKKISRLQQTYQGIQIWGQKLTLSGEADNLQIHGNVITGLSLDLPTVKPMITAENAVERGMARSADLRTKKNSFLDTLTMPALKMMAKHQSSELYIYIDEQNKARLTYLVNWVESGKEYSRPFYFIDALNGEILEHWEGVNHLAEATGPGGNEKTGQYFYGIDFPALKVTKEGNICRMDTPNVEIIDMKNKVQGGEVFQFTCPHNTYKYTNGAYAPLNDALFFSNAVFNMYRDWYDTRPIKQKLRVLVHSSAEGTLWDGQQVMLYDGGDGEYPSTTLDIIAHEIAHGTTEELSLIKVPGHSSHEVSEFFSDIAGEAAEFYLRGSNDWLVGHEFMKITDALRYFEDPTLDDISIKHFSDFDPCGSPYANSGVLRRAFYLIATSNGWNTRKAFDIFFLANEMYWGPATAMVASACDALRATKDLEYDSAVVVDAFDSVGISLSSENCARAKASADPFTIAPSSEKLKIGVPKKISGSTKGGDYHFILDVPTSGSDLFFKLSGISNDSQSMGWNYGVSNYSTALECKQKPEDKKSLYCYFNNAKSGTYYGYIFSDTNFSGLSLVADFE